MNELSINQIQIDYSRPINNRAKLDTGKLCNYSCDFCYYKDHLMERDDLETIFKRVNYILNYGIDEIDLSGGESSIEPNWFKILEYCSGKFKRISCLSHGGKFSDDEFIKRSYDLGLREILFSIHGTDEETHDKIVGKKGAFKNLLKAIENAHQLNIEVRLNTTLCNLNYDKIDTSVLLNLNPSQINFIALNYWRDNSDGAIIDYGLVCAHLKTYIDSIINIKIGDIDINARYFPLCYMIGYEQYVKNHYHHIYDLKDWNKAIYNEKLDTSIQYDNYEKVDQCFAEANRIRLQSYFKTVKCVKCKYFFVCDGIENELKDHVKPIMISGDKIRCV